MEANVRPAPRRIKHCLEQRRRLDLLEQVKIGDHTVAADEAGLISHAGKEVYFIEKIGDFSVVDSELIGTVQFLGKSDEDAEITGLGEFGEFQRLTRFIRRVFIPAL